MSVAWPQNVNQRILRSTDWEDKEGFIEDESLAGKTKRRAALSTDRPEFRVKMRFTQTEYVLFRTWWKTVCLRGVNSFQFPTIDAASGTSTYRFRKGGAPKYFNTTGVLVDATMTWEEV